MKNRKVVWLRLIYLLMAGALLSISFIVSAEGGSVNSKGSITFRSSVTSDSSSDTSESSDSSSTSTEESSSDSTSESTTDSMTSSSESSPTSEPIPPESSVEGPVPSGKDPGKKPDRLLQAGETENRSLLIAGTGILGVSAWLLIRKRRHEEAEK